MTTTKPRRPAPKSLSKCRPCPACGAERLPDADGKATCVACPLPIVTDRRELYRAVAGSAAMDCFRQVAVAVDRLRELIEAFDGHVTAADSPIVAWLGDTAETDCLANDLLLAVGLVEHHLEVVGGQLPALAR